MYPELYQYLILNRKLPVPGIGTFLLERAPAQIDFPNKLILPPVYTFSLQPAAPVPPGAFFRWLGQVLGISQMDAVVRFNDFAFEARKQLEKGHSIDWKGVGLIRKGLGTEMKFEPHIPQLTAEPVAAVKVLREKAEHTVRVGEEEKTSAEMEALLTRPEERRSYGWVLALGAGLLALVFTGWYLSEHGLDVQGISNSRKLDPDPAVPALYQELH